MPCEGPLSSSKTIGSRRAESSLQTWLETDREQSQFFALSIALCFLPKQEKKMSSRYFEAQAYI